MPTKQTDTSQIEPAWDLILEELGIPPEPPAETASTSQSLTPTNQANAPDEPVQPPDTQADSVVVSVTAVSVTTTTVTATLEPLTAVQSPEDDDSATTNESAQAATQPARLTTLNNAEEPIGFDTTNEPKPAALPTPVGDKNKPVSPRQRVKLAPVEVSEPFGGGLIEDLPPPVEPLTVATVSDEEVATFAWSDPVSNEPDTDSETESASAPTTDTPDPHIPFAGADDIGPSKAGAMVDSELESSEDAAEDSVTEIDEATAGEVAEPGSEPTKSKRRRRRRRSRKKKKGGQQPAPTPVESDDTVVTDDATDTSDAADTADSLGFDEADQNADAAGETQFGGDVAGELEQLAGTTDRQAGRGKQRRQKGHKSNKDTLKAQPQPTESDDSDDDPPLARNPAFLAGEDTSKFSEELLQTLRNWNVPSWNEVIAGLYRPER